MSGQGELRWTVVLWKRDPKKLIGVVVACLIAALFGYGVFHSIVGVTLGPAMVLGACADYLLPQHFEMNGTEITRRCGISVTSIEWSAVKRVYEVNGGLKFSPLESNSRLEQFRGVQVLYDENRELVLQTVSELGGRDV